MRLHPIILLTPLTSFAANSPDRDYTDSAWWTVYLTAILCLVTLGLMLYTAKLWHATVKLSSDAERSSNEQRTHIIQSLQTAERAAAAAEQSATVSAQSLSVAQRAFVFWKGFESGLNISGNESKEYAIKEYVIFAHAENVGVTPAQDVRLTCKVQVEPGSDPQIPIFKDSASKSVSTVLGPKSGARSAYLPVSVVDLYECWEGRTKIFVWMRLEYKDIFNSDLIHHHEQCAEIQLIHDPREIPSKEHPPYLQFATIGTQNSSS